MTNILVIYKISTPPDVIFLPDNSDKYFLTCYVLLSQDG